MKHLLLVLFFYMTKVLPVFSGDIGSNAVLTPFSTTYLSIGGGLLQGGYQSNYTNYLNGILAIQQSYNDKQSSGYAEISLGVPEQIGSFVFDHQFSLIKLGGSRAFTSPDSSWLFKQDIDLGYDWLLKFSIQQGLSAYGILGVQVGRFKYSKIPYPAFTFSATNFNNHKDQIGFNLGLGMMYQINSHVIAGIKYQHLEYASAQVEGTNAEMTSIDIEHITPVFNLVGAELRYYW